ncbi:leukocyte elastase inhibitor-like [Oppia nitens]|uniref:leukocyte elastase inhibitor-like n=1 Tax=Oppia nitens TaxID=1686743 RepID=UPI0023DC5E22|nr:leukocyte elastase inhibitor-like [Oppia nitens]
MDNQFSYILTLIVTFAAFGQICCFSFNLNSKVSSHLANNRNSSQAKGWIGSGHMQFTLDLLNSFVMTQSYNVNLRLMESLVFSPFSIQSVLMQLHLGARSQTKQEIANILHIPPDENNSTFSNTHEMFGQAVKQLIEDINVGKSLSVANQIFYQEDLSIAPTYSLALAHYHNSQLRPMNFAKDSQEVLVTINDWIEKQTHGLISNFLTSPPSPLTSLMAINAIKYKGDWHYKFDAADTESNAWFQLTNGQTTRVQMMVSQMPVAYAYNQNMQSSIIELPYRSQRLGLFLLLPNESNGIFNLLRSLNSTALTNLIASMRKVGHGGVNIRIPKFSIDSMPKVTQVLKSQFGLKSLFSDAADLSSMFSRTTGSLNVDELLHKAILKIDEQGSVGAAVSATNVERVGVSGGAYFEADHPFIFFLMDKQTGLILFAGIFAGHTNNSNINKLL